MNQKNGFTLIETVVAIGVFGLFFMAVAFILQQILTNVGQSRVRSTALALAQSRMEVVRNLPYAQVGTVGGIPSGPIAPSEIVTINSEPFTVTTSIQYIDDPFDGVAPADTVNSDYKRVRVAITWEGTYPSRLPVTLVSNIVPKGVENTAGGGTLFIQVYDANGLPISNATVSITNTTVNPAINTQILTNSNGVVTLPGAPPCITCYQISTTKSGYSTDKTYSSSEVANPLQPHATILESQITQASFTIDLVSSVAVNTVSAAPNYSTVVNVAFTLRGAKVIGYDTFDNPVYKYQFNANSGGGSVNIPNLEWDTYTLDFTNSAYNLGGSTPTIPITVLPSTSQTITAVVLPKTNSSLLLTVKDGTNHLLASASAHLTNTTLNYDVTQVTQATASADFGQTFFNNIVPETYDLSVNLSGYEEATASVEIVGNISQTVTLNLAPQ